jgi:sugar/nucleoside kinase (ribokinase family)
MGSSYNPQWDVLGLGNSCVDYLLVMARFPRAGESLPLDTVRRLPGGQVAGAMVGCARLGLRPRFLLRTGADAAGQWQREALAAEGVDLSLARELPDVPSALAYILLDERTGERAVIWNTDARLVVQPGEITEEMIAGARAVFFDGKDEEACLHAAALARRLAVPVVCDIDSERPRTRDLIPLVDHFVSNEEFVTALTGCDDLPEALRRLRAMGPGVVCATCATRGALAWDGQELIASPAFPIQAVDSTGAGDAFHAGYLYGLLAGWDLRQRLRFANATAGLSCQAMGSQTGMPTRAEVEALLESVPA